MNKQLFVVQFFFKPSMCYKDKFTALKLIKILLVIVLLKTHNKTLFKNSKLKKIKQGFFDKDLFFNIDI